MKARRTVRVLVYVIQKVRVLVLLLILMSVCLYVRSTSSSTTLQLYKYGVQVRSVRHHLQLQIVLPRAQTSEVPGKKAKEDVVLQLFLPWGWAEKA